MSFFVDLLAFRGNDIFLELDDQNSVKAVFLYGEGIDTPVAMLRDENNNGKFENEELFVYTRDHLGSIREVLDSKQRVLQRYSYSSYGETKLEKISNSRQDFVDSPFGYTSREWDQETGDYFYRARYYNPEAGRFISEDPIGFDSGEMNLYRYVENNPMQFIDPYGEELCWSWLSKLEKLRKEQKKKVESRILYDQNITHGQRPKDAEPPSAYDKMNRNNPKWLERHKKYQTPRYLKPGAPPRMSIW